MFTTPITAPPNFSSTEIANESSTTFVSSGESTTSLSTLSTTLQTPITSSDITTDSFETTSVQGGYNMTTFENEGSGGVPIPAVVVPVVIFACVGLAVILIVILRRR